jgi:hypothetical protein
MAGAEAVSQSCYGNQGPAAGMERPPFNTIQEIQSWEKDRCCGEAPWTVQETAMTEKPTPEQLAELKKLSKEARVDDWSEVVQSKEEAAMRIQDLKIKARIE